MPRVTVGGRQAEHKSQGESIEEDDMVIRVGSSLGKRRTDKESKEAIGRGANKEVPSLAFG